MHGGLTDVCVLLWGLTLCHSCYPMFLFVRYRWSCAAGREFHPLSEPKPGSCCPIAKSSWKPTKGNLRYHCDRTVFYFFKLSCGSQKPAFGSTLLTCSQEDLQEVDDILYKPLATSPTVTISSATLMSPKPQKTHRTVLHSHSLENTFIAQQIHWHENMNI